MFPQPCIAPPPSTAVIPTMHAHVYQLNGFDPVRTILQIVPPEQLAFLSIYAATKTVAILGQCTQNVVTKIIDGYFTDSKRNEEVTHYLHTMTTTYINPHNILGSSCSKLLKEHAQEEDRTDAMCEKLKEDAQYIKDNTRLLFEGELSDLLNHPSEVIAQKLVIVALNVTSAVEETWHFISGIF